MGGGWIMPILTGVSTLFGVSSALQSGAAEAQNYQNQAAAAQYNAAIAEQNARLAREQAAVNEDAQRREAAQVLGRQRAAMAQGGVLESASSKLVMNESANLAELDALNIRYQGQLQEMGLLSEASMQKATADNAKNNAKIAKKGSLWGAGAALISGASSTYGDYDKWVLNKDKPKS